MPTFYPARSRSVRGRIVPIAMLGLLVPAAGAGHAAGPAAPSAPAAADSAPPAERLKLSTSDGVALAAWYYPAVRPEADGAAAKTPPAVAILLHDLGGSHESVQPLARELQARGIAVVAPDLRGHGVTAAGGRGPGDAKSLKKPDFDAMTMTGGGRVREQAENRGDIEALRNWLRERADTGGLDMNKLVVIGSGVGAAVAAQWTVLDAKWPDLASGPQGGQVRGLVLVSPAWTTRGFSISPALAAEPVRRTLPVLVIGGSGDADAVKLYEQLKRLRPEAWSEKRAGQKDAVKAKELGNAGRPTLYLRQFDADLSGDGLASAVPKDRGGGYPAAVIDGFVAAVTAAAP